MAWFAVVPGLALLAACGGGGAGAVKTRATTQTTTATTQAAMVIPRVVSSGQTSRYLVDPPAPTDSTSFSESDIRSKFLAEVGGPATTIQTIALARVTDKLSLVQLPPQSYPATSEPANPAAWRIDHLPAIVVIGLGPPPRVGGPAFGQPPSRPDETVIAAFDPASGQLIEESWESDNKTLSLSAATP